MRNCVHMALVKLTSAAPQVAVRYKGKLASSGKVFDETKGQKTFKFRLGAQHASCYGSVGVFASTRP